MQGVDKKIYEQIAMRQKGENGEDKQSQYGSAFMMHVIFKAIPVGLLLLKGAFTPIVGKILIIELILIFIVIDFWLTKNVTGRRMIGLRWSFDDDQYGVQRFRFQGRVNEEFVSGTSTKLFWVIQFIYMVIPILFLVFGVLLRFNLRGLRLEDILLYTAVLIGGAVNFFFFWKARSACSDRRTELDNKLGRDFTRKMGLASIVSFL